MKYLILILLVAAALVLLLFTTKEHRTEVETGTQALDKAVLISLDIQMKQIGSAVENYQSEQGHFPETLDALSPQYLRTPAEWRDPWGMPIQVRQESEQAAALVSAGPDRIFDTADDVRRSLQ